MADVRAFTRAVSPRLSECQLTYLDRVPIDAARAAEQHSAYESALSEAGFEVVRLEELADDPDAVFVEDTALLLGEHAIITRPGAQSRIKETDSTAACLREEFQLHRIESGFLDGGDVLRIGRRLYVGLSTRTDATGISGLSELVTPLGYEVVRAELRDCLHLKSGATFVGCNTSGTGLLIYSEGCVDPRQFEGTQQLAVEEGAANCLLAGDRLIRPSGNPRTAALLSERGFNLVEVDVSELQKAEAGVTCMSLIDQRS